MMLYKYEYINSFEADVDESRLLGRGQMPTKVSIEFRGKGLTVTCLLIKVEILHAERLNVIIFYKWCQCRCICGCASC